jgi:hypothetical protein
MGGGGAEAAAHCLQEGKEGLRDGVALGHMRCGATGVARLSAGGAARRVSCSVLPLSSSCQTILTCSKPLWLASFASGATGLFISSVVLAGQAGIQLRGCLVGEKKVFGYHIGYVGRMSGGVFGY